MRTLVLGVGNTLLTDEGVGVHVVNHLQAHHPKANTTYLDGGTLSFTLAGDIEDSDQLIVIDATELKSTPGTVKHFIDDDMDAFLSRKRHMSVHEVGLLDLLNISRLADRLPARRALIGIQPKHIDWGDTPSPEVAAAIPRASQLTLELIDAWQA